LVLESEITAQIKARTLLGIKRIGTAFEEESVLERGGDLAAKARKAFNKRLLDCAPPELLEPVGRREAGNASADDDYALHCPSHSGKPLSGKSD